MAGALAMVKSESEKSTIIGNREQWQWQVKYSRCFTYPSSHLSTTTTTTTTTSPSPSLSSLKKSLFKPTWISSSGSATVSLHLSADAASSSDDSIITVSLLGTIIEEHFISKLHFTWPQVSCLSGFPARGSLVVFASYKDSANEKQKFALRFSATSETEDFVTSLEDILSNKLPNGSPTANAVSALTSQSGFVPPYRPDTSSIRTRICASPMPAYLHTEDLQDSQAPPEVADSESNIVAYPPRFTSLVSNCSAEIEHGNSALVLPDESKGLKAQIAKYMQDASFLDIVNKVNDVISELGEGFVL